MDDVTISREQARELDRRAVEEYGLPSIVLMENAGRGAADLMCRVGTSGPVVICCGGGNNGGDGFVLARHLDLRGHDVRVLLFTNPDRLKGDAQTNYAVLARSGVPVIQDALGGLERELNACEWIVDALLGTGARGEPRAPISYAIGRINEQRARNPAIKVLAIDLPSGMDCDAGEASSHTIRATHTCTFVALKPGFLAPEAKQYTGEIHVVDIGAPRKLRDEILNMAK